MVVKLLTTINKQKDSVYTNWQMQGMNYFTSTNTTKQKGHKMRIGKRIMYDTMNSWNGQKSLAYNLKIYNVIRSDLRQKAYEFFGDDNISCELYADIDSMIDDFTHSCNCCYTAGFNGRSGGYLVLYKSSKIVQHKDDGTTRTRIETYMTGLDEQDVPSDVKKKFHKLAQDIVNHAEQILSDYDIVEQEIMIPKKIKTLKHKGE